MANKDTTDCAAPAVSSEKKVIAKKVKTEVKDIRRFKIYLKYQSVTDGDVVTNILSVLEDDWQQEVGEVLADVNFDYDYEMLVDNMDFFERVKKYVDKYIYDNLTKEDESGYLCLSVWYEDDNGEETKFGIPEDDSDRWKQEVARAVVGNAIMDIEVRASTEGFGQKVCDHLDWLGVYYSVEPYDDESEPEPKEAKNSRKVSWWILAWLIIGVILSAILGAIIHKVVLEYLLYMSPFTDEMAMNLISEWSKIAGWVFFALGLAITFFAISGRLNHRKGGDHSDECDRDKTTYSR